MSDQCWVSRTIKGDHLGKGSVKSARDRTSFSGLCSQSAPTPAPGEAVLRDLDFALHPGELVVVIGPNGAGKSTLLRVLSGTLRPQAGTARLFGDDFSTLSSRDVARRLAVVSQTSEVAFGFRVEQVVMMGRSPHQGGLAAGERR